MERQVECLKPLSELVTPDRRSADYELFDERARQWRASTLEDFYARVAAITLHPGVPLDIREHFASAQNALAYSWFYYPFNVTAQFLAFVSIEYALRERFGADENTKFYRLVERAVNEGMVVDAG